ncbi:hypothetical protein BCR33DRAFT_717262 [Rhizoclosmatium globosum]|uniref:Uncharacterized protein n=1 Tax=Rhizoclosmatium globosum TaxID=329046 RepID=A0A1Y2CD02_9FUNG|nr:hypothetical protein BCR33DRAFT_717262 [Rhizoclosmatium globosum]|eukprot:ORY44185.1 hypothetical protein BCR33DRAFT_717262 [Rhizoclosmatium globosum]
MSSVRPRMLQSGQFPRYSNRTPLNTPSINIVSLDSEQADSLTPLPPTSNPSALLVRSDGWDVETLEAEEISVNEAVTTLDRYQNARKNTGHGFYSDSEDGVLQSVRVFPNNRRNQDTPLHEYLDSMVSIHLMKIGSKTTPLSIPTVKTTKQATITPKKFLFRKLKTKTPRPSARISERKSIVHPTPPQSDTESLDLRFNKAERESRNLSEAEIPYWIDIFLTASILLEKHVIMIQRTWRRYQNENRHVHFLDAVVYLQRSEFLSVTLI